MKETKLETKNEIEHKIKEIRIDLSDLSIPRSASSASLALEKILDNYQVKLLAMINIVPRLNEIKIIKDYEDVIYKTLKEINNTEDVIKRIAEVLATKLKDGITVVKVNDAFSTAVAFVKEFAIITVYQF